MQTSQMGHRAWQTTLINLDTINPITLLFYSVVSKHGVTLQPAGLKVKILLPGGGEVAQGVKVLATNPHDLGLNHKTHVAEEETNPASCALTSP